MGAVRRTEADASADTGADAEQVVVRTGTGAGTEAGEDTKTPPDLRIAFLWYDPLLARLLPHWQCGHAGVDRRTPC